MARQLSGTVVSDKMNKTIVVAVDASKVHPLYRKRYTRTNKYHAHDEDNQAKTGDSVIILEANPISKKKRWVLSKITETTGEVK